MSNELKTYSFTEEDMQLIKYALRKFSESTTFGNLKDDAKNLLEHIKRMEKEKA